MTDETKLLKSSRRNPLTDLDKIPLKLNYGREDIERVLPHRDPFLLVDRLTGLDIEQRIVVGSYYPSADLPLFRGHFPEYPVYPGSLQVEAIGQAALSLVHFIENKTDKIGPDARPPNIRATRICGAYYRGEVRPGDTMTLLARVVEYDAYLGMVLGQVLVDGDVKTAALMEVAFL